jgi:GTP 3',8-cyclase
MNLLLIRLRGRVVALVGLQTSCTPSGSSGETTVSHDSHGRVIHDLRVSITDRCNYKCVYCRTGEVGAQYPELGIEEYLRLIKLFVGLGITKVRLTGGEPLLRRGLVELVQELARLRTWTASRWTWRSPPTAICWTLAAPLKAAGLNRVTVSMDAVDAPTFERITRVPGSFEACWPAFAPRAPPASRRSRSTACCCAASTTTRSRALPGLRAKKTWWCASSSSCRSKKAGCGRRRSWCRSRRLWSASAAFAAGGVAAARGQRDGAALYVCRRRGRDRHHRAGQPGLLRSVQPRAAHLRRQDSHLPVFAGGARSVRPPAGRSRDAELRAYIAYRSGKEARHHIGEPGFLKPSRSMVHIGG